MNSVLVPMGLPAYLAHTSNPSVPNHGICSCSLFLSARGRTPVNLLPLRGRRESFPLGSWRGLRSAIAGSPVGMAESDSRCAIFIMSLCYGRVVHLRQLPTPCCHDAVAFGFRQVNLCLTGTFTPLCSTHSQAHDRGIHAAQSSANQTFPVFHTRWTG